LNLEYPATEADGLKPLIGLKVPKYGNLEVPIEKEILVTSKYDKN